MTNYSNVLHLSAHKVFEYDWYAPDGFDNFEGSTAIELKIFRTSRFSKNMFYQTVKKFSGLEDKIQNLIFIIIGNEARSTSPMINEIQNNVGFNVYLWEINDLIKIFRSNEGLFEETYLYLNALFLKDAISISIKRDVSTYLDKRKKYIEQLNSEYRTDNIVLFLGAGASLDAKISTWDTLISELFVALIDKELSRNGIEIEETDKKKIAQRLEINC